jgi:hypothetical protein
MESLANALITTDWDFANSSVESATTQSFRRYFKKINHFGKDTRVSRKEPKQEQQVAEHESETTDRACVPYSVGEFMNNRNQKMDLQCLCRFEERGEVDVSCHLHTLFAVVRTKSHELKAIYKKDGKEIRTTVGWHQTMI